MVPGDDGSVLGIGFATVLIVLFGAMVGFLLFLAGFAVWAVASVLAKVGNQLAAWLMDEPTDEQRLRSRLESLERRNEKLERERREAAS
jgi:hypothetical protein